MLRGLSAGRKLWTNSKVLFMNELLDNKKCSLAFSPLPKELSSKPVTFLFRLTWLWLGPLSPCSVELTQHLQLLTKDCLGRCLSRLEHRAKQPHSSTFQAVRKYLPNYQLHLGKWHPCLVPVSTAKPTRTTQPQFTMCTIKQHCMSLQTSGTAVCQLTSEDGFFSAEHQLVP